MIKFNNIKTISLQDWDRLVTETFSKIYSLQQQEDCMERQTIHFSVPCEEGYSEVEEEDLPFTIPEVVNGDVVGVRFESWLQKDSATYPEHMKDYERRLFWERNFYPNFTTIVNDLHAKGLIDSGKYAIIIDW